MLVHEVIGLLKAVEDYQNDSGAVFSTYATIRIRGAMLDEMYAADPALILLPKRPQGMAPTARRFLEALEVDGRVAERYVRRDDLLPFRVCFVRADLESAPGERRARVLGALDQLPTYGTAIMRERSAAYR